MKDMLIEKDQALYEKCQAAEKDFIKDWETLVNIDSPTNYGEGMNKVGGIIIEKLKELGASVEVIPSSKYEGSHVVGTFTGKGKGRILIMAHMDTVLPVGTAAQRPFRIDEQGRAYGPGVSDLRNGIVQSLYAIKMLRELNFDNFAKITFLSNCDEEDGSISSKELVAKLAKEHDCVLCMEAGKVEKGESGEYAIVSREGVALLEIEVKGLSAHAGNPYAGRNAAEELAHLIVKLKQLENLEKRTLLTTRILESGTANRFISVVPDRAEALLRVGMRTPEEMDRIVKSLDDFAKNPSIPGTEIKINFNLKAGIFVQTEKSRRLGELARAVYAGVGVELKFMPGRGGSSDANFAASTNDAVIDGLAIVGADNHSPNEWADARTVVPKMYLLAKLLMELGPAGIE